MTTEELNKLIEKAKTRKDGVYSFRGYYWAVKNKQFIAFVNPKGQLLQRSGNFNVQIGQFSTDYKWERRDKLKEWLKKQS